MKLLGRITVEAGKCGGRPCIRGQRFRVTDLLELLAAGASHEEILRDYSFFKPTDIGRHFSPPPYRPIMPCSPTREVSISPSPQCIGWSIPSHGIVLTFTI